MRNYGKMTFKKYAGKVEQAINQRKKGVKIIILHENDFGDVVEDNK